MYVCICVCEHVCVFACMSHVCECECMCYVCEFACMCVCLCVHVFMCVCVSMRAGVMYALCEFGIKEVKISCATSQKHMSC